MKFKGSTTLFHLPDPTPELREAYASATPFPHFVFDSALKPKRLREVKAEIDAIPNVSHVWRRSDHPTQVNKLWIQDLSAMPPKVKDLIQDMNSREFIAFLSDLTGIRPLLPDPELEGGGIHRTLPGGALGVHADFNLHPRTGFHRRLNVLLYLNHSMREWGGQLELWSKDMTSCEKRIDPIFNRMVIFTITDDANHGHPELWTPPQEEFRNSLALYYYSPERPEHEKAPFHWADWKKPL